MWSEEGMNSWEVILVLLLQTRNGSASPVERACLLRGLRRRKVLSRVVPAIRGCKLQGWV
jgi:hypothetical protein